MQTVFRPTDDEYRAVTAGCGLVDRSERGKLALVGSGSAEFLNGQVTNDIEALSEGTGCYAAFLTPKGKMLGDLRVLKTGDKLLLDTERSTLQNLFDLVTQRSIGYDTAVEKRTLQYALLSLIGPQALSTIPEASRLSDEHSCAEHTVSGVKTVLVKTVIGVDIFCATEHADSLRMELLNRGAKTCSEAAAECVRIELGIPRYGYEMDSNTIPQEAGINDRSVSFTKGCYVGQETVARLFYKGKPNRHLCGLKLTSDTIKGTELTQEDKVVGSFGSLCFSPKFGLIGLALLRRSATFGSHIRLSSTGDAVEIVKIPFRDTPSSR